MTTSCRWLVHPLLLLLCGLPCLPSRDVQPFDMNESIRSMGDSIFINNEHVCEGEVYIGVTQNFKLLERCTVIDGDLIIATLNKCCVNASFPRLKEVTGKFIVYYTMLESLAMFPNLVVIRGRQPLKGYSLIIVDNLLPNLHFPSLRVIQNGGVRISKNHELCYVQTILWSKLLGDSKVHVDGFRETSFRDDRALVLLERNRGICPDVCNESARCPQKMVEAEKKELCWSANACQSLCDEKCTDVGLACWMNATSKCCHPECLGGCYGDGPELCVACKHFVFDSKCVVKCPPHLFEHLNRTCVTKKKCIEKEAKDATGYRQNVSYSILKRKCVRTCPATHRRNATTGVCERCSDNCLKACGDAFVYNVKTADKFLGCTSLRRLYVSIREEVDNMKRLIENFRQLRHVEHSVRIINAASLTSLAFLANLRSIGEGTGNSGNRSDGNLVFEVIANDGLEDLWTPKHTSKVAVFGRVRIYLNRKLCANKIFAFLDKHLDLRAGNLSTEERTFTQKVNGDMMPCNVATINLTVMQTSSRTAFVKLSQAFLGERSPFVTLLMIKPSEVNISLAEDRPSCLKSSWSIHELQSCANTPDGALKNLCIHTVDKLQPATRYAVFVERKTTQGDHGAISPVVYFHTQPEPPSPPRDIRVSALSSRSLKVRWRPPKYPNGSVKKYFIWYRPLKLNKIQFARRSFCTHKTPHPQPREDSQKDAPILLRHNDTGYTCEDCDRRCPAPGDFYGSVEDVNYSFEDSLQNHIFVKRPKMNGKKPQVPFNSSRLIDAYEPYVTTSGEMRKSTSAEAAPEPQNVTRLSELKASTPDPPVAKQPVRDLPPRPTASPPLHVLPKDDDKTGKIEWEGMATVDANESEIILTNLRHYTEYIVAIRACQEPRNGGMREVSSSKSEGVSSEQIPDDSDQYPMNGYDSRVCSKKASHGHRTLADDRADSLQSEEIDVNRENGLRVLWTRPRDPNGMILVYWFHYRRVDEPSKKSDPNFWIQSCVPLRTWFETYHSLQQYRLKAQGITQQEKLSTSPPAVQTDPSNVTWSDHSPVTPSFNSDDHFDSSFLDAKRGGYQFPEKALSAGEYEFLIMAYSLAGNGSETKVIRFRIGEEEGNPYQLYIYVVLIAVFLVVLVFVLLYFISRRHREGPVVMYPNPDYAGLTPADEWEIPKEDIVFYNERALGRGYFGVVVKGVVRNLSTPAAANLAKTDNVLAAIKTVRKGATYSDKVDFLSEANRMKAFHSEHIVKLLGVVSRMEHPDSMPQVVLEFMYHGDMGSYLKQISEEEAIDMLSEAKIMLWAAQIADGMAYLGHNRVIHRDLAARNCLVDAAEVVKISDFGMTRELYYQEYAYKKIKSRGGSWVGPFMWMAPEALARGHFSYQSDVWSFGVVLWEIATLGARPYPNMTPQGVKNHVTRGLNLLTGHKLWDDSWKRRCPDSVMDLMRRCFAFNEKDRPTFMAILQSLEAYMDDRFIQKSFYCQQYTCQSAI